MNRSSRSSPWLPLQEGAQDRHVDSMRQVPDALALTDLGVPAPEVGEIPMVGEPEKVA